MTVLVEACIDSVTSAVAAERGGAGRLELCDNLLDGGTTPSAGMIAAVKAAARIPVFVIVRPRGGGFIYSNVEANVVRLDIEAARMIGADGIVVGALTPDGRVDEERMHEWIAAAGPLPVTFHRAFDATRDAHEALETLMRLRVARVLTAGGSGTALEGAAQIAALVRRSARGAGSAPGEIAIMAGGGVREETVQELVHRTGVREVHVRGTRLAGDAAVQGRGGELRLRKPAPAAEGQWEETDEKRIREFVRLANG